MRILLLVIIFVSNCTGAFSQDFKISIINDTTELHEYDNGQKIKVNYRLNNRILLIQEKEELLQAHPGIYQDFNIKNDEKGITGEVNFSLAGLLKNLKYDNSSKDSTTTLDILKNLKGQPFPIFSWIDINGNKVSLSQLKGKTVVLNFWHTSCVPCVAEMPLLNKLVKQYESEDVVFIASTPNTKTELQQFRRGKTFAYQQVGEVDPKVIFSPFPGWPIHIVLNGDGLILYYGVGKKEHIEQELKKNIDESLKQYAGKSFGRYLSWVAASLIYDK